MDAKTRGSALLLGAIALAMLWHGPISQPATYHQFADDRALLGIPHAVDVLSNLGFAAVGAWGLARAAPEFRMFSVALVLTAFGSGWYHLAPDDSRLVWDRIPIVLACVGLLAAMSARTGGRLARPLPLAASSVLAIVTVPWWWATGDLRPYILVQLAPLVLIPVWQALRQSPRNERVAFAVTIAFYALAKIAEAADHAIFDALGFLSGHSLKHLLAAAAAAAILRACRAGPAGPPSARISAPRQT